MSWFGFRNSNTAAAAAVKQHFSLNRTGSAVDFECASIVVGKEQEWTTTSSTVDGYMAFHTILNETAAERLRIASSGSMTMNGAAGTSPIFEMINNDNEDTDTGRETSLRFSGHRSGGEDVVNAQISGHHAGSSDNDNGLMILYTNNGTGLDEKMRLNFDEIIINQNDNDQNLRIESENNANMLFVDAGNDFVGIGTNAPASDLQVFNASGTCALIVSGQNNNNRKAVVEYNATDGPIIRGGSSGITSLKFAVDNSTLAGKFDTNADFYTNDGTVHSLSDIRVKTDVEDLSDGLDIVKQLKPRTFRYTEDSEFYNEDTKDEIRYGFVANEVEAVAPQYTDTGKGKIGGEDVDDLKSLSTTKMIPMLVKAIQEQQEQIEELKAEIATLKGE